VSDTVSDDLARPVEHEPPVIPFADIQARLAKLEVLTSTQQVIIERLLSGQCECGRLVVTAPQSFPSHSPVTGKTIYHSQALCGR
jgi:hypothetical protein